MTTPTKSDSPALWVMPAWMEPYRGHFRNAGGWTVEALMSENVDARANWPVAMLQACILSQVGLLVALHEAGLLAAHGQPASGAAVAVR